MVVKFHLKMDNDSILTYHVHNSNIKIAALIMSTAVFRNIIKFEILSSICASIKIIFHI